MTVYLVRHASAGDRHLFAFDDLERPLDERGQAQAQAIAAALAPELAAPVRLVSSRATRCLETLAPLAAALNTDVEVAEDFTEGASPTSTMLAMRELVSSTAVVCSHGDVLPELVRQLMLDGMRVVGSRGCEMGSIWKIEALAQDFVQGNYMGCPL